MVPLVIIRPEPGNQASTAAARKIQMEAHGFPLFEVAAKSWEAVPASDFDALLVGSANVFRYAGRGLGALRGLPVYAVGEATAAAAREADFAVAATGSGTLQGLLALVLPVHPRLLRLSGEERVLLTPPAQLRITERVVYTSLPRAMPPDLTALLRSPAIVALHSADAAQHLTAECVRNGIRRAPLSLAALSYRIAAAAGEGWGEVAVASSPDDKALLALARQMCQDRWPAGRTAG